MLPIFPHVPCEGGEGGDLSAQLDGVGGEKPPITSATDTPEAGKGGGAAPPLPPLQPAPFKSVGSFPAMVASDVFTPAPAQNPVLLALQREKLYRAPVGIERHLITCPWSDEHEDGVDAVAVYTEPNEVLPLGTFTCGHAHGNRLHIDLLLDWLEVEPAEARTKPRIRIIEGEINRIGAAAEYLLAVNGQHFHSGGRLVALKRDEASGDLGVEAVSDQALIKALSKVADWEKYDGRSKKCVRCDPKPNVVSFLLKAQSHDILPMLGGLARQPYFRADGTLVTVPGYDPVSNVYADFNPDDYPLPEPTEAAAREALALLRHLLREFHFGSAGDMSAALSAILTATTRGSIPFAPAFNISASGSSSGKSYLAATIGPFAGPGQPMALPYPTSEDEASKKMMSLLLAKPAVAIFDDMQTDWMPHGTMNRMLTSETMADRLLGGNRTATVSTRCFFMGTGNNVRPVRDMCRRVVTIYLSPRTSSPATLRYADRPADAVKRQRGRYVAAALTIIRAWRTAGCPRTDVPYVATYGDEWADMARHPLIALGEPDPATSLIEQLDSDPDSEALGNLMQEWFKRFGSKAMMVRELAQVSETGFAEALRELPIVERNGEINRDRFGWILKKNANKVLRGLELKRTPTSQRTAWSVTPLDGTEEPALPASGRPDAEIVADWVNTKRRKPVPEGLEEFNGEFY
ncbi:hypothetical protein [Sphingomonas sp.]|uniref:hypothetical protein n=1 Tax=Sphingomonas sp. TaxID=28214 RepID=UPI0035C806FC